MTIEKRGLFPISLAAADNRSGAPGGRRVTGAPKVDFRRGSLRKVPLLANLSEASIKRLDVDATKVTYAKGQEIITRADTSRDVYILLSGQARVTFYSAGGKAVAFRRIDPGDVVGEFAAIDGQGRSATVEAMRPAVVLSIGAPLFWELTASDPAFAEAMMRHLVRLLRGLTARIVEFSTLGVKDRIHCELLRMAREAMATSGKYELNPAPTHSDLAARISTHREAVSRELSRLSKAGILERKGRVITVRDVAQLERMVQDVSGDDG